MGRMVKFRVFKGDPTNNILTKTGVFQSESLGYGLFFDNIRTGKFESIQHTAHIMNSVYIRMCLSHDSKAFQSSL